MKVHLNQIPDRGLHVEGTDPGSILDIEANDIRPISDVRYSLDVGLSDGGLFATGEIGVDLDLQCVACLTHFDYPLEVPAFAFQAQLEELGNKETVDLTEPIREDILLALPPHPHCDWNGQRTCKGAEQLDEIHSAAETLVEDREVWGALDQLKIKKS